MGPVRALRGPCAGPVRALRGPCEQCIYVHVHNICAYVSTRVYTSLYLHTIYLHTCIYVHIREFNDVHMWRVRATGSA